MPSQNDAAAHLDLSAPRLRQLIREGALPAQTRGEYDLDALRVAYIRHLRKGAIGRPTTAATGGVVSERELLAARLRIEQARAEQLETANAVRRGELLELDSVVRANTSILETVKQAMMAVPVKIAPLCVGMAHEREIKAVADDEIRDALRATSELVRGLR